MKKPNGKIGYQLVTFLHEVLFLFISSFLSFPLLVKRNIFFLFILTIINLQVHIPLWKKKVCILLVSVDVDPIPSFEIHMQHDKHIPISLEADYSGHL